MSECVGEKGLLFKAADLLTGRTELNLLLCRDLFDTAEMAVSLKGDVKLKAELRPRGEDVMLNASLIVPFEMVCSRCLKSYEVDNRIEIEGIFRSGTEGEEDDESLDESSHDISFYGSDKIDIFPIIRDNVYLSIPMKPLCSEECRGVCPQCGTDLNSKGCNCVSEDIDPRLEVLKSLWG